MNNFIEHLNKGNKIGLMLLYGENGSYIPIDIFYFSGIVFHTCHNYDLNDMDALYCDDDVFFVSNNDDSKIIIIDAENCVKLFKKYVNIEEGLTLNNVDFDIFKRYKNITLKNYRPYNLDDLSAYYKAGIHLMGRNYSFIPVIVNQEEINQELYWFEEGLEENIVPKKYIDSIVVKKLKKRLNKKEKDGKNE